MESHNCKGEIEKSAPDRSALSQKKSTEQDHNECSSIIHQNPIKINFKTIPSFCASRSRLIEKERLLIRGGCAIRIC